MDYDKILVLEKGEVIEFGTPLELLNSGGVFTGMCMDTGEMDLLTEIASRIQ